MEGKQNVSYGISVEDMDCPINSCVHTRNSHSVVTRFKEKLKRFL
jgi:hypothetical protein